MGALRVMPQAPDGTLSLKGGLKLLAALATLIAALHVADRMLRADSLPVQAVHFEGPFRHVTQSELEAAVRDLVRGNFLLLDLAAIQAAVEALPWVHTAAVRRMWPRDLHVRFTEQRLVARWGEGAYLNDAGEVVRLRGEGLPEGPLLEGPEGTSATVLERYEDFRRLLAPAGLAVERLTLTPRRSWRVQVEGGFTIVLDRTDPQRKLARFARVYPAALAGVRERIRQVDLRYANGFAVEWRGAVPANGIGNEVAHGEERR